MKDTPGWASPGSAPSDGQGPHASGPADSADRPAPAQPADQPGTQPQGHGAKWSNEQPPPGQWSAPTGSPVTGQTPPPPPPVPGWGGRPPVGPGGYGAYGGGGHGPGGYGAWGAGWGGPPPAAKPGVIPLRPLGVGEILDGAVSTMRTHWRTVLGMTLVVAVVVETAVILLQGLFLDQSASTQVLNDPNATPGELGRAMGEGMLNSGVVFLVSMAGILLATGLLATATSRAVLGKSVTTGEAWRDARPQLLRLLGLIILLLLIGLAVVGIGALPGILVASAGSPGAGAALAVLGSMGAGVVALWLAVRFSLATPALMLEKQGITKAMSRSVKLVRGSWWRVFGIQLLALVIQNIVAAIIVIPFAVIAAAVSGNGVSGLLSGTGNLGWTYLVVSGVGAVIGSMITLPISAGVTGLLYVDQRIRREALDLELARAAGVQGYGSDATTPGS
ncbi:glycerophosphoryl diester phosphodiesterase membrane domain-containing protein [Streptomyces sp. NPDC046197]|uniref:glycerophosphoryl diester phosphodiesterase membrane domain-containing protein n=1 Tax=Streptomyces sp. NPDC046197 TaxID=3154337 RepID=UPI0034105C43